MNLAYFRKSNFDFQHTTKKLKEEIVKKNLSILAETNLSNNQGIVFNVCNSSWLSDLVSADKNFIGLMPCSIAVIKKNNDVFVGVGNPNLIGKLTDNPALIDLAQQAEKTLKEIVEKACGVGPLKVKSVKLYATLSCPYCKMEAAWLDSQKIKYEQIYVDLNPKAAEEMVQKTGQMGVPVTEIVYDNEESEFIIGFDKPRLTEIFAVKN